MLSFGKEYSERCWWVVVILMFVGMGASAGLQWVVGNMRSWQVMEVVGYSDK